MQKITQCAALYGLHRLEAFPMDVWMKRAMAILFPGLKQGKFANPALPAIVPTMHALVKTAIPS